MPWGHLWWDTSKRPYPPHTVPTIQSRGDRRDPCSLPSRNREDRTCPMLWVELRWRSLWSSGRLLCCMYPSRSSADLLCCEGQCVCCHNTNGSDRFPEEIQETSGNGKFKHESAVEVRGARFGESSKHHSSQIISFISSASMAGSSQRTPSPVSPMNRPICPSVMHRTNLSHGVSRPSRKVTHALAVL